MLILQDVSYVHPNKDLLFEALNLSVQRHDKIALIGNNGTGKSTLLRLLAGELQPARGAVRTDSTPWYVPQLFGQYNGCTVAEALGVAGKLGALHRILAGDLSDANLALLEDDWTIEERCRDALTAWGLGDIGLMQPLHRLSGGEKTKAFLAGIAIHDPDIVLLDEPSNHLDTAGRALLYDFIQSTRATLVVVSHDRALLRLLPSVAELGPDGITLYGGSYDFYTEQKAGETAAFQHSLKRTEKELRKAREGAREALERQQKLDARGRKKQEKAGLPTISMNTLRNNAEKSTARTKEVHTEKTGAIADRLKQLRSAIPDADAMRLDFGAPRLHRGKVLVTAVGINAGYGDGGLLWKAPLDFEIRSGERIALKGANGSGKSTLLQIILGEAPLWEGRLERADFSAICIDQEYSLLQEARTVYEQAQQFNNGGLTDAEIRSRLTRFLFTQADWDKPCGALSGGERLRLVLCALSLSAAAPDLIVLDEPTNNLDIQNTDLLTAALRDYPGTLLAVSHDAHFLEQIRIGRELSLE